MASRGNYHNPLRGSAAAPRPPRRVGQVTPQYHGRSSSLVPSRNPRVHYGNTHRSRTSHDNRDPYQYANYSYGSRGKFATDFATYEDDIIVEELEDEEWADYEERDFRLAPERQLSQSVSYDSDLSASPSNSQARRTVEDWNLLFDTGISQESSEFSVSAVLPKGRRITVSNSYYF